MKMFVFAVLLLLTACTPSDQTAPSQPTPATAAAPESSVTRANAEGVVEAVDPAKRTITIAHGPVPALGWPAMTMTFQAPAIDLSAMERGEHVAFEFSSIGMEATITGISQQ